MKRRPLRDRSGEKHGRLRLLRPANASHLYGRTDYECLCDCGRTVVILWQSIKAGTTKSCGCLQKELMRTHLRAVTHGKSKTPTYAVWSGMKRRCFNKRERAYPRYGGRGITVCERWLSFENFLADMGERPFGTEIDRIDVNGNYEPGNCRWATIAEQANNKRNTRSVLVNGVRVGLLRAVELTGHKYATVYYHAMRSGALPG